MTASWLLGTAGLIVGALFGALAQRTHFCTMGAISDLVLFGGRRRLRSWLLAIAVALLLTQAGVALGVVAAATPPYRTPELFWLGSLVGGALFGFGMVLAGGCASRNLVRLGSGSLKSLVVVVLIALSATAVTWGPLAGLTGSVSALGSVDLTTMGIQSEGLDALLFPPAGDAIRLVLGFFLAGVLGWYCLQNRQFRSSPPDVIAGLGVGVLVVLAWVLTSALEHPASLNFVWPHRGSALNEDAAFWVMAALGAIAGSGLSSWLDGSFRLEWFVTADDAGRHITGGVLMGLGGGLAGGCTIALGVAGVGALGLGSLLALLAIGAGAWAALRRLEGGALLPRLVGR